MKGRIQETFFYRNSEMPKKTLQITTRPQMERLFKIVAEIQTGAYPNCAKFVALFEEGLKVTRRTIMRDIEYLRDQLRAPLEYDSGKHGYYFTDDFNLMPPIDLKNEDFLTLYFLQQCLAPYEDTVIGHQMKQSFNRMFGMLTGTKTWKKWDSSVAFRGEPKMVKAGEDLKTFEVLFAAIQARKTVKFEYRGRGKSPSDREVDPGLVVMQKGRWYLYAVDRDTGEMRTFLLGRIQNISVTQKEFNRPVIQPEKLFEHSFGVVVSEDAPQEVVIEFTSQASDLIRETVWHPTQKLESLPNGGVRLRLWLNSFYEIKPWILSWGHYARVLQPPQLVEELQAVIKAQWKPA